MTNLSAPPKQSHAPPIGRLLRLIVMACFLPGLLCAAWLVAANYFNNVEKLRSEALARARTTVTVIDRQFQNIEVALAALATTPYLRTGDLKGFREQAVQALKAIQITNLVLTGIDGRLLVNLEAPEGMQLPMHSLPGLIKKVVGTGTPEVSDLFRTQLSGKPVIILAVPVFDRNGKVSYVLSGSLSTDKLTGLLRQQNLPESWLVSLLDSTGTVSARTRQPEKFIGIKASQTLRDHLSSSPDGTLESRTLEGIRVDTAFAHALDGSWAVVVSIPYSDHASALERAVILATMVCLGLLFSGLLVAMVISRRIGLTMARLQEPTLEGRAMPAGEALAFREAEELSAVLAHTSQALMDAGTAARDGEARLSGILESALDAIITVDPEERVVLFNFAAVAMFGWQAPEIVGQPMSRLIPEKYRVALFDQLKESGADGVKRRTIAAPGQTVGSRKNGDEFPIEASISRVEQGGKIFLTIILRDITSRLRNQRALERSNEDLKQFAYVASHDLKGPLRSIHGFVRLLERSYGHLLDDRGRDLLGRTARAADRLEGLTEDLLVFAQLDGDTTPSAPVNMHEVLDEAIELLQTPIENAGGTITVGTLPTVLGVKSQLVHIALNLIGNALKYTRNDNPPRITVSALRAGGQWMVGFHDEGAGIPEDQFEKIFEVFSRVQGTSGKEGAGIGLALCRRLVQRQNGRLWVESKEGAGSSFWISLPSA